MFSWSVWGLSCTAGAVQLGEGGILEVSMHGVWGHVCYDGFGYNEVEVACRSLGSTGGNVLPSTPEASGSTRYWFSRIHCEGYEDRLEDCQQDPYYGQCYRGSVTIECGRLSSTK